MGTHPIFESDFDCLTESNMSDLWLISVPGEHYSSFNQIPADLATRSEFKLPELKVGTLDTLILLSDDLAKADNYGESIVRKVAAYTLDVLEGNKQQMLENLTMANNQQPNRSSFYFYYIFENIILNIFYYLYLLE